MTGRPAGTSESGGGADPMTRTVALRHRRVAALGLTGAALGVLAGTIQASVGSQIPQWSGAKASPLPLGLLTIGLSVLAGIAAIRQRDPGLSVWARTACAVALLGPGLLCLSTVGRLWYPSAVLLVVAGFMTVDSWPIALRAVGHDWPRVLLSLVGGFEILMAAAAPPLVAIVGLLGGLALLTAAWWRSAPKGALAGLVAAGTIPFAGLGWAAVVPLVLAGVAGVIAIPIIRGAGSASAQVGCTG